MYMSHVTCALNPALTLKYVPWCYMCAMTPTCVPWLLHMCHDPYTNRRPRKKIGDTHIILMWYDSYICAMNHTYVPWLMHMCHDSYICAMTHTYISWLIHLCHDSYICVPWLIHTSSTARILATARSHSCDMSHTSVPWLIHMRHDSYICVPWLIHMCAMTDTHQRPREYIGDN